MISRDDFLKIVGTTTYIIQYNMLKIDIASTTLVSRRKKLSLSSIHFLYNWKNIINDLLTKRELILGDPIVSDLAETKYLVKELSKLSL